MCGRFTQAYTWAQIVALYRLTQPALNLQSRYNIAPTDTIDAVVPHDGDRELVRNRRLGPILLQNDFGHQSAKQ